MQGGDDEDDYLEGEYLNNCFLLQNVMHRFLTGNEFKMNKCCRYHMDNESITPQICQAVDFVHMVEALMLVCGENTVKRHELVEKFQLVQDAYLSHSCRAIFPV
jgi:hypothetical protein